MKTGYFARASENGHKAKFTKVHIIDNEGKPICRYRPHKTMQFCFNAEGIYLPYVECDTCRRKAPKVIAKIIKAKSGLI